MLQCFWFYCQKEQICFYSIQRSCAHWPQHVSLFAWAPAKPKTPFWHFIFSSVASNINTPGLRLLPFCCGCVSFTPFFFSCFSCQYMNPHKKPQPNKALHSLLTVPHRVTYGAHSWDWHGCSPASCRDFFWSSVVPESGIKNFFKLLMDLLNGGGCICVYICMPLGEAFA